LPRPQQVSDERDPVVQDEASSPAAPLEARIALSFEGIGNVDDDWPPDTNASVGERQVVEAVNESYDVFDKQTGRLVFGPRDIATLFTGMRGLCGLAPIGPAYDTDPIVVYDKAARRWLVTMQISFRGINDECIAVSTTPDATGSYYRYDFTFGNVYPDYPKFGVWPDAYYASYDTYHPGAEACAYDRNAMLAGAPASAVCFQLGARYVALLPADWDGARSPPIGEPNTYVDQSSRSHGDALNVFAFHADFARPENSRFTGPTELEVPAYGDPCPSEGGICVPQFGTRRDLDTLSGYMMMRLAYRNFGDHESLVVNHNVRVARARVAVRWYEIRNPQRPVLHQAGTLAEGDTSLWLGSIAMDRFGNMALGFSASSDLIHPSIRFTGRQDSDPLGRMRSIVTIIAGGGSQTGTDRWGDYSSMALDPVDDCSFWYANEFLERQGRHNWQTWLAVLRFPDCHTVR